MCVTIWIDDQPAGSVYALRKKIGRENLVWTNGMDEADVRGSHCLCGLDIKRTAKKVGRRAVDEGFMEYAFLPAS